MEQGNTSGTPGPGEAAAENAASGDESASPAAGGAPEGHARRVVMVIEAFPPEYTGTGVQLALLARALRVRGQDVRVLTSHTSSFRDLEAVYEGVRVVRLAASEDARRPASFAQRAAAWLFRHRGAWDLVHIHGLGPVAYAGIGLAVLLRKRSVLKLTLLGADDPAGLRHTGAGALRLAVLRRAGRVVATTASLRDNALAAALDPRVVRLIPNGVDLERFAPLPPDRRAVARRDLCDELGLSPDAPLVMFLGSLERRKGLDLLAQAWNDVVREIPEARLLVLGPAMPGFEGFLHEVRAVLTPVADTVQFLGRRHDPQRYLSLADVFVFPSRREGLPNALLEAQAAGVPSVTTDIPGVTTGVVEHGVTGLVVTPDNAIGLANSLLQLLHDPALREAMGRAAREHVAAQCDIEHVADAYAALYAELDA